MSGVGGAQPGEQRGESHVRPGVQEESGADGIDQEEGLRRGGHQREGWKRAITSTVSDTRTQM